MKYDGTGRLTPLNEGSFLIIPIIPNSFVLELRIQFHLIWGIAIIVKFKFLNAT